MAPTRKVLLTLGTLMSVRGDGLSTLVMGLAAMVTAWCAFESTKWGGIQSLRFAESTAARTESNRSAFTDLEHAQLDVTTFLAWVQTLQEEGRVAIIEKEGYRPDPTKLSGFLFLRFRAEFRPVIDSWVATRPLLNPEAPPTPFDMEGYRRPLRERAQALERLADEKVRLMHQANRNSDNYMLVTVVSAMVIFFGGMSTKLRTASHGALMLLFGMIAFLFCLVAILQLPVVVF